MQKLAFSFALIVSALLGSVSYAGFLVFADPADLQITGPGPRAVDIQIRHNGSGLSTLSGYTIRFGSPANASLGVLPAGVTASSATAVLAFPSQLFNFSTDTNSVAHSGLGLADPVNVDIGNNGVATLFTMNFNLAGSGPYTIGVDVQNAQRGGLLATEIASEFNASSPTTDFSFTLSAIPEPTSLSLLVGSMGFAMLSRRRRQFA